MVLSWLFLSLPLSLCLLQLSTGQAIPPPIAPPTLLDASHPNVSSSITVGDGTELVNALSSRLYTEVALCCEQSLLTYGSLVVQVVLRATVLYAIGLGQLLDIGAGGGAITIRSSTRPSYWAQYARADPVRDAAQFARVMLNDSTAAGVGVYRDFPRVLLQGSPTGLLSNLTGLYSFD